MCGSIFSSYIHSRMKTDKPTVIAPLSKHPIQLKTLLHGWDSILDVLCLFLYSSTVVHTVCQLMLNLCMLVRVLIPTPPGSGDYVCRCILTAVSHLHFSLLSHIY